MLDIVIMIREIALEKKTLTHDERQLFANSYGAVLRDRRWMWRNINDMLHNGKEKMATDYSEMALHYMKSELELELDYILENAVKVLNVLSDTDTLSKEAKLFYNFK